MSRIKESRKKYLVGSDVNNNYIKCKSCTKDISCAQYYFQYFVVWYL